MRASPSISMRVPASRRRMAMATLSSGAGRRQTADSGSGVDISFNKLLATSAQSCKNTACRPNPDQPPLPRPATAAAMAPTRARWLIILVLFLVSTINYADRATLSIVGTDLSRDLRLDAVTLGFLLSAFSWSYVALQIPGGWLLDRLGLAARLPVEPARLVGVHDGPGRRRAGSAPAAPRSPPCSGSGSGSAPPRRRRSRPTAASSRSGSRPRSAAWPRRSSTPPSIFPRSSSTRSWARSRTPSAGPGCSC